MKIANILGSVVQFAFYTFVKMVVAFIALCILTSVYATYFADKHIIIF